MKRHDGKHDWTLASRGDPHAEPGSAEWAVYTRSQLHALLEERESSIEHLTYAYDAMIKHQGWQHLCARNKKPFANFDAFCFEPKPWGLGYKQEAIEQIIKDRKAARGGQQGNKNNLKSYTSGYKEDKRKTNGGIRLSRKSCDYLKMAKGVWMKMTEEDRAAFRKWISK